MNKKVLLPFFLCTSLTISACGAELRSDERTPFIMKFATSVIAPSRIKILGLNGQQLDQQTDRYAFDHGKAKQIFFDGKKVGEFPLPDHFDKVGNLVELKKRMEFGKVPYNGKTQQLTGFDLTKLSDGRMLISGGQILNTDGPPLGCTWLLEQNSKAVKRGPDMHSPRAYHQATTLSDGRILISGGMFLWSDCSVKELEIYDPKLNKITVVGRLNKPRKFQRTIEIPGRKALIISGETSKALHDAGNSLTSTVEVLDLDQQTVTVVGQLHNARIGFSVFPLDNGKVLIAGGSMDGYFDNPANSSVLTVELFPADDKN